MDPELLARIEAMRVSRRAGADESSAQVDEAELADWVDSRHFEELDSTQSYVEREFRNFNPSKLTVVSADFQTSGRGTRDRTWHSRAACSALMTFFVRFPPECNNAFVNRNAANATQVLALSAVDALDKTTTARGLKLSFGLKWPNDVIAEGGKIAGILARAEPSPGPRLDGLILGIGLNLNLLPEDVKQINAERVAWPATSLLALELNASLNKKEGDAEKGSNAEAYSISDFRSALTMEFAKNLRKFFVDGFPFFRERVNALDVHMGKKVLFKVSESDTFEATYVGLNDSGNILLQHDNGKVEVYPSGEIVPRVATAAPPPPAQPTDVE